MLSNDNRFSSKSFFNFPIVLVLIGIVGFVHFLIIEYQSVLENIMIEWVKFTISESYLYCLVYICSLIAML